MRKPSFSQPDMDDGAVNQMASLRLNTDHKVSGEHRAVNSQLRSHEMPNPVGQDSTALLGELDLRTGFGGTLDFAPSEFVINREEGNIEYWKAETQKLRGYLSKARIDNKRLEGEAEELAENYGKLMNKYNKATTAAIIARSQRGISEATIKGDFEELSRQISGWVDEVSDALDFSSNINTTLDSLLKHLGFPSVRDLSLTKNCVSNIVTVWLWHRILAEVFPSTSKATDLWATSTQSQTIFEVSQSMQAAGDSWTDIQSWLCTTANALMPGRCYINSRTSMCASLLWTEISPMWQTDATTAEEIVTSLREDIVAAAVSFSLQLRKGRTNMSVQFPGNSIPSAQDTDKPGECEFCLTPELKVAAGGAARDGERTVIVESRKRTLQLKRRGL